MSNVNFVIYIDVQLVGIEMVGIKLDINMSTFHPLGVLDCDLETQLRVCEKINKYSAGIWLMVRIYKVLYIRVNGDEVLFT